MEFSKEQKLMHKVLAEAWKNPTFKQELIDSPEEAIERLTGEKIQLPEGVTRIEVVDQTDTSFVNINIPAKPNVEDIELTDAQLEVVSGGRGSSKFGIAGGGFTLDPIDIVTIPVLSNPPFVVSNSTK